MTVRPNVLSTPPGPVNPAPGVPPPAPEIAGGPGVPAAPAARATPAAHGREGRIRVYIWEVPVRATHWVTAGAIVVLSVTGLYIADPFLIPAGGALMTTIRLTHMLAAFVLLVSGLLRTFWLLRGNRFAHWKAFIPLTWFQFTELFRQAGFYAFIRKEIPKVLGHNQLAAAAYLVLFALLLVEVVTGFALDGLIGSEPGASAFGWLRDLLGTQTVRVIHHLAMWGILAIALFHIYSCVLVDHIEKNGLVSSIFSGFKFPTREEILESRDGGPEILEAALEAQAEDEH
jgi:Ni/Fe-hydrogenase 1 B-type cytochrome subunit